MLCCLVSGLESLFVDSSLAPEVPSTIADLQISDDITYFFDRPDKLDDSLQQSSSKPCGLFQCENDIIRAWVREVVGEDRIPCTL